MPAVALGRRASTLLADEPAQRVRLLPLLGHALRESGDLAEADAVLADATELARSLGDEPSELRAAVERGHLSHMLGTQSADELRATAERAIAAFDTNEDLSDAWQLMGTARLRERDRVGQLDALLRAREHAIASGDVLRQISAWNEVGGCMLFGPTPLAECAEFAEAELAWAREHDLPAVEADALLAGPYVDARLGDFATGREKLERSKAICRELGIAYGLAEAGMAGGELEVLAGDLAAAERELREAMDVAAGMEAAHYMAVYRVRLARVLHEQGRHEDAAAALEEARPLQEGMPWWKSGQARVLAARGQLEEAVALAHEAAAQESGDQDPTSVALTLVDLAEVLVAAGNRAGAEAALGQAVALNESKGNIVAAHQCRERLTALQR